jgi:hypothetical protein
MTAEFLRNNGVEIELYLSMAMAQSEPTSSAGISNFGLLLSALGWPPSTPEWTTLAIRLREGPS